MKRILFLLSVLLFIVGCGGGKSTYAVKQFLPDYPPPVLAGQPKAAEAIRIEPFSTAQAFASTAMFYRPSPFELGSYSRERWRVMPGDMVTDFLLRDIRNSDTFKAVLAYEDPGEGRYAMTGTVAEFLEVDGSNGPAARLSTDVTLMDVTQREITRRVVFQKTYTVEEAMKEKSARALAESMSRALKKFSGELMGDLKEAFRILYMSDLNTTQALEAIGKLRPSKELNHLADFIRQSKRGIAQHKGGRDEFYD